MERRKGSAKPVQVGWSDVGSGNHQKTFGFGPWDTFRKALRQGRFGLWHTFTPEAREPTKTLWFGPFHTFKKGLRQGAFGLWHTFTPEARNHQKHYGFGHSIPSRRVSARAHPGCGIPSHRKPGTIKNTMVLISPDLGKRAGAYLHTYIPMGI